MRYAAKLLIPSRRLAVIYKGELADFSDHDLLVDFINPMPVLELGHAVQTDDLSFVFDRAQLDFIHEL